MENILYHYTTGQGLLGILNSIEFHATNIDYMNDPMETKYFDNLFNEVLENDPELKEINDTILDFDHSIRSFKESFNNIPTYVISFCKSNDLLPMWKYYAHGNGYNIGFDIDIFTKELETLNARCIHYEIINIIYDKNIQIQEIQKYLHNNKHISDNINIFKDKWKELPDMRFLKDSSKILGDIGNFISGLFKMKYKFKHEAYKDENEVRLLLNWNPAAEFLFARKIDNQDPKIAKRIEYKVSAKGTIIEYLKVKFPVDCVKTIMCSPQTDDVQEEALKTYIERGALDISDKRIAFIKNFCRGKRPSLGIKIDHSKISFRDI